MGFVADAAAEAADAQPDEAVRRFQTAVVIAVDRKAGGMSTGTSKLMEL